MAKSCGAPQPGVDRFSYPSLIFCGKDLVWAPGLGVDAACRARGNEAGIVPAWRVFNGDE